MSTIETVTRPILQYIEHGTYPDSESISSTELGSDALDGLLNELRKAQDEAKNEIRGLSKQTAPDIDTWISRAKELQEDIQRSRETARRIVREAEAGKELRAKVEDKAEQVRLLEKEVLFNDALVLTLSNVRDANRVLDQAQDAAVKANVKNALDKLQHAEEAIVALQGIQNSRVHGILKVRTEQLRESMVGTTTEFWNALLEVSVEEKRIKINREGIGAHIPGTVHERIGVDFVAEVAHALGIFDSLLDKFGKDVERAVFRPRLMIDDDDQAITATIHGEELFCTEKSQDTSSIALFRDLQVMLGFLSVQLPTSVSIPLSEVLVPAFVSRMEEQWLDSTIPLHIADVLAFQDTLGSVVALAEQIDGYGWHGAKLLRDWAGNVPRSWLTKQRETILGDVRNLVFTGLKETKIVERIEVQVVQVVRENDPLVGTGTDGEKELGTTWEKTEGEKPTEDVVQAQGNNVDDDDDDASAWDVDDVDEEPADTSGDTGEDAWGWGDDDAMQDTPSSVFTKRSPLKTTQTSSTQDDSSESNGIPVERELTLRETFTVTLIPENLTSILQTVIADAQTLTSPDYASSTIAPAATALYTLPTLALAVYRATAPTAYSKLSTGNMLIYNDASHLSSELGGWQASQAPASRLRLDNDVKALESFAKRAYSTEMEAQRTVLRDLLDGAQGFANCTVPLFKAECESAVEQVVSRVRDVHAQWKDILSQGALLQTVGSLVATVVSKMVSEIEDLGDISEADSHQLTRLCHKVSEVKDLFLQVRPGTEAAEATDMAFIYCPNWLKFQYLAEILESSLADIKYLWNEGELSLEFEADEVVELIEALFAESDMRRRAIAEVRRGGKT